MNSTVPLILVTGSRARRKLILAAGLPHRISFVTPHINEARLPREKPRAYVQRLARAKALSISVRRRNLLIIAVDTVVVIDGEVIGKPRDVKDAKRMLKRLSGRWHTIMSGLAVRDVASGRVRVAVATTRVKFLKLTSMMIDDYVKSGEPFGKAGGYAVQGKGVVFIDEIRGSLTNVIGLPLAALVKLIPRRHQMRE